MKNESSPLAVPNQTLLQEAANGGRPSLASVLARTESAVENALGNESPFAQRLGVLRARLQNDRFQLAVLGQFKRGKSSFINALLGAPVLPTGVIPLTAVATFIVWRASPLVTIYFRGQAPKQNFSCESAEQIRDVLFRFVAEEVNPKNKLQVERVELHYPADILFGGTTIIDTPGVGSTLQHNTQAALQVLPECDAAVFIVSADPPITEVELDYLHRLKAKLPRVFFALNKADYLGVDERRSAVDFLQNVLASNGLTNGDDRIFLISARDALAAKTTGDTHALEASGFAALENYLVGLLASKKARWLEDAVRSKAADTLALAAAELDLRRRALNMPLEELGAKSAAFQDALVSIEDQRRVTRDLLAGDHRRLRETLESRIQDLRKQIGAKLARVIDSAIRAPNPKQWEQQGREAVSAALQEEFEAAREPLASEFAAGAGGALHICQDRVNALVDSVRLTAAQIFDVPLGPDIEHERFELGQDPYWVTESKNATLIPDASLLLDRLLPAALRRRRLLARMGRLADELIVRNAENLRWAVLLGLDETFRKATAQFEQRLDETITATRDVICDALARRQDQSYAIRPELDRLSHATEEMMALRDRFKRMASK
jgi:GTP-binding protein EngB required for normal cell division